MKFATLASLVTCLALAACANPAPNPGLGDPYPAPYNDPQVAVLSPDLQPWLGFDSATVVEDGRRPLQVQVPVRNLTDNQYLIQYRFIFLDANGMEIQPVMGWTRQPLEPKQRVRLNAGALGLDAVDYRLEVRWAR